MKKIKAALPYCLIPVLVFLTVFTLFHTVFVGREVLSKSMEPALKKGSAVLVNRLAYKKRRIRRGDIILFDHEGVDEIKRVIALPGEEINFLDGFVIINDKVYVEDYIDDSVETNSNERFTVPKGCYFVLGDNREDSYDSRFFEDPFVKKKHIKGRAFLALGKGSTGFIKTVKTSEQGEEE